MTSDGPLARLIASGAATCSVEAAGEVLQVGRCTAYEQATAGAIPTIRVGRRLLVPVPRLLSMLGIDLPAEWRPAGALADGEHECSCRTDSGESMTECPKVAASCCHLAAVPEDVSRR